MQNRIYNSHILSIFGLDNWHTFKGQICLNSLASLPIDCLYFCGLMLNVFLYELQDLSGPEVLLWVDLLRQLVAKFRF